jgi:hypothetical protein
MVSACQLFDTSHRQSRFTLFRRHWQNIVRRAERFGVWWFYLFLAGASRWI